ncbi:glycosyltransferase [Bacillus sp. SG-1]|uniref:glycosyltransferase n=1 Tax=Bacillus sp. SG-1 TaxID=161544 RepID=UPI000154527A|nr:glycosyltransferase [Bacillus sp. SG-1]EDL64361.1 glycosyltransferase [Bacillus sp. SG-1]
MKVILLAPSRSIHTHKWAKFYQERGIQVKVATFSDHYSEENAKQVDTFTLPKHLPGKMSYFSAVFALRKLINEFKPDILHAHYVSSYGVLGALANFHPYYVSVWGRDVFQFPQQGQVNKKLVEFALKKADVICSTSKVMAVETNLYTDKEIHVTPFGVNMEYFNPENNEIGHDKKVIGTVKALEDKYGIGDLVRAFAIVHENHPDTELLIVGDGRQRKEYEDLAAQLGIANVTTFTGKVPNEEVPDYIKKMTVFAVPSTENSESFGVAAVESMACGVPVVVSNIGGLPEVVVDGITGIVVPKENPQKLAEAFTRIIEDRQLAVRMGEEGIKHVAKHFNWIDNANYMLTLYDKTLKGGEGV